MNKKLLSQKNCFSLQQISKNYFAQGQRNKIPVLQIYDGGNRNSVSGIRATIFGATGFMGPYVGAILGYIGSDLVFPHNHDYIYDDDVKELKLCAASGYSHLVKHMDFDDTKMIDNVIKNSNVVINLVGPRYTVRTREECEYINIDIASRIADACARNQGVKRLIQFSSCGAESKAESMDFATKWIAEQEVLSRFPNATIFRPTTVYGMNDYFMRRFLIAKEFWYNSVFVTDDCSALRQPILVHDVAQCVLNALKLPETAGQTYEIGGPHQYSLLECYEIFHNLIQRPPKLVYVPTHLAKKTTQVLPNWSHFSMEAIIKHQTDIVVKPGSKTIEDLYVRPIGFQNGLKRFLHDSIARYDGDKDLEER